MTLLAAVGNRGSRLIGAMVLVGVRDLDLVPTDGVPHGLDPLSAFPAHDDLFPHLHTLADHGHLGRLDHLDRDFGQGLSRRGIVTGLRRSTMTFSS